MKGTINRLLLATIICGLSLWATTTKASHVPGGNITYECVGPNQFAITLTLFEDCGTAFEGNFAQTIQVTNTCGFPNQSFQLNNVVYQQEVSQLCPQQLGQSECSGGTLPGVWMHQWTSIITLPGQCDSWVFSYTSCCRNTAVNSTNQDSYYWQTVLNSQTAPCNNSAEITAQPIPYVCINQPVNFNMAAVDLDGDNLVFSLIPAMSTNATTNITYAGGYTGANPINGITINPATGQINFTPTVLGNFIVAVLIEEFDANGNLTGSVIQDFQIEVINCVNQVPAVPVGGITNYTGGGAQTGPNSIEVCEGDNFCFNLTFTDTDATNTLTVTSNIQQIFPGAVVTTTGTNPVTVQVCHTVPSGAPANSIIAFEVEDDACPIPGVNSFPITVSVISSTYAGMDQIMCLGQGAQLDANGGSNFNWVVLSGDPINIGTNFSCNNCPDPIANPAVTTTYVVTSNLSGGCTNIDTVTINVVPDFTFTLTQASPTSCLQDPIDVSITTNPGGAFTYNWTPATYLSNTNSANVTINAMAPGTYDYTVTITSPQGCVKTGTTSIVVFPAMAPTPTAFANPNVIACGGGVTQLGLDLGGGVPATCGPSTSGGCSGPTLTYNPGAQSGSNTSTSYPAIWGNWYKSSHHQMIFTAAELNAMGFMGGKITRLNIPVTQINGTTLYRNVQVQMGCTSQDQYPAATWITALTPVFGPTDIPIAVGNNYITLTTVYEWDGISNLVVDICSDNTADASWTQNSISAQTTTPTPRCLYLFQDFQSTCGFTQAPGWGSPSTIRPKIEFTTCPSVPDSTQFSYQWTPSANVVNPNAKTTNASPTQTTTYTVTVTNNNGGCTATSSVQVIVDCLCFPAIPSGTNVSCNGGTDGTITATMNGTTGPWTVNWYNSTGTLIQSTPGVTTTDVLTGLAAGTYTITTIDTANCSRDTTFTITQPTAVVGNAGQDAIICISNSTTLNGTATGGTAPYTFGWSDGGSTASHTVTPASNTCYDLIVTDANGCTSVADQVCIFLNPPLIATAMQDVTICPNTSIALTATGVGGNGGPYTITWTLNGNTVGTGSPLTVTPPAGGSEYCAVITDNCGTPSATDCVIINWEVVPTATFTASDLENCIPLITTFTNTTDPTQYTTATWNFGDGTTSSTQPSVGYSYTVPGCYDVTLTLETNIGCTATTTVPNYVCAHPYPVANYLFGPQPTNLFAPDINFVSISSSDAITFFWDFAGMGTATTPATGFTFPNDNPGTYPVMLAVSNQFGCTDTIIQNVIINGIYTIYAPNAFTPDGDGRNDLFFVTGEGFDPDKFEFFIFNRWGEVIFQSESIDNGWDGTHNGQKAKNDVYVWKIKSKDMWSGEKFETYGHVTLIR